MSQAPQFSFNLLSNDGRARRGKITCAHGVIETPTFMPVGTAGTVKAMTPKDVEATGAEIILGNTYHLMLRPSAERVASLGGLHKFMNWSKPILTDSGGYQVFSLSERRKLTEQGVTFRSHLDGAQVTLSPERSIEIQTLLNSDISMVLDECTGWPISEQKAEESMKLSMRWAARSQKVFNQRPGYALFGIVQGGVYPDLRKCSAQILIGMDFDGYAIGGLAVGEGQKCMLEVLEYTIPLLPTDKPHYLMGVGKPEDIVKAVSLGVDMFDCVMPTRSGRTAQAFVRGGVLNLRNAIHADDARPLDILCECPVCNGFSRAYLHHLVKAREMLAGMLLTNHNLYFYQRLMSKLRTAIEKGSFLKFQNDFNAEYKEGPSRALELQ
ncbi:MAG: tRNA guanosine(34) transglycosylase Tgt [Rhodospirillaceae bacterium]|nr:tRNA guanosine(34) transglycosylase Tgt [Rhodospirillaceae bacterium]